MQVLCNSAILRVYVVPGEAIAPPGNLLEMQILSPRPQSTELETQSAGPSSLGFHSSPAYIREPVSYVLYYLQGHFS